MLIPTHSYPHTINYMKEEEDNLKKNNMDKRDSYKNKFKIISFAVES